jgi:hypothetical protein
MVKSTLDRYKRQSMKYLKNGPSNVDDIRNSDPDTIVKASEMMRLHRRILRLIACVTPEDSCCDKEHDMDDFR